MKTLIKSLTVSIQPEITENEPNDQLIIEH